MDLWVDLISPFVGAVLAVSTIFFPFSAVIVSGQWHQTTNAPLSAER